MAPARRQFKRESTTIVVDGVMTPNESMSTTGTITPKQEDIDISFSDNFEDKLAGASFQSHDGLPVEEDQHTRVERQRRSASVSARTSRPSSRHTNRTRQAPMAETPAQTGLEFVGQDAKILVDAINDLRQFDLDHVVQLPELVLVGDQSAGKSSLMSALTEVQLPRDQGMCTKCPANIKTSPATFWNCKISLQQYWKYVDPGQKVIDSKTVTRKNPFPPWTEQKLEVKPFKTIYDKNELQEVMKWAQIALLNHDDDYKLFIPGTGRRTELHDFEYERDHTKARFSPNVIAVEISGPGLPALSFYDLPGIFRVAPDPKDQYLAKVIENLAIKYIEHPEAVIIWTLAMKTDPSNSSTGKVIQDCKAGDRCIGVLTNPDHVQVRHVEYEKILQRQAHVIGHGYFVTKQPGDAFDLTLPNYHARARREEIEFFEQDHLWKYEWQEFRERCGTLAIQKYLSQEFAKQIAKSIPKITEKIEARAALVDDQLRNLPELPDFDIRSIVQKHLAQFSGDVQRVMDGDSSTNASNTFQSSWTTLSDQFRDLILHVRPMIIVSHPTDKQAPSGIECIVLDDDDEDGDEVASTTVNARKRPAGFTDHRQAQRQRVNDTPVPFAIPTLARSHANPTISTPQTGRTMKRENGSIASSTPRPSPAPSPRSVGNKPNPFAGTPFENNADIGKGFIGLDGIRSFIHQHTRTGMPGLVNHKTYDELCMLAINPWSRPLEVFKDHTLAMLRAQLEFILEKNLGHYSQTELYKKARRILEEFVDVHELEQQKSLDELYKLETYRSFSVNCSSITEHEARELKGLKLARKRVRAIAYVETQMENGQMKKLAPDLTYQERKKAISKKAEEVREDQLPADRFDLEIRVAAYLRGYYMTAAYRFVDSVCLSMHGKLFRNIRDKIFFHLETKLGIIGADGEAICKELMEENEHVGNKRRELREEKSRLEGFSRRLAELERQARDAKLRPEMTNGNNQYNAVEEHFTNGNGNYDSATASEDQDRMALDGDDCAEAKPRRLSNSSYISEI